MICDQSANSPVVDSAYYQSNICAAKVAIRSSSACYSFTVNPLFRWIDKQAIFLGAALILGGLYLGILGKRQFKISICMIGGSAFTLLATLFMFTVFLSRDSASSSGWIIIGVGAFFGIFVGLALAYFSRVGAAVAAGWGGVTLALILYNSFVYKIDNDKQVAFWIFVILTAGVCAILAFVAFWHVIIVATSFVGSYCVMRGISLYAGGFPGELEVIELIKNGQF